MIKVSITNETNQDCVTSTWCIEDITSLIFLTNMHNLNLDYEEKMASPNWGTFYKINGLYYAKLSKPMKYKTKECFRWENRDDDWMHPVILDWEEHWCFTVAHSKNHIQISPVVPIMSFISKASTPGLCYI